MDTHRGGLGAQVTRKTTSGHRRPVRPGSTSRRWRRGSPVLGPLDVGSHDRAPRSYPATKIDRSNRSLLTTLGITPDAAITHPHFDVMKAPKSPDADVSYSTVLVPNPGDIRIRGSQHTITPPPPTSAPVFAVSARPPVSSAHGKRDRAPERMRGQPAWRLNALIYNRTARLAQAGERDRAPELMRGQPAWRLNAL